MKNLIIQEIFPKDFWEKIGIKDWEDHLNRKCISLKQHIHICRPCYMFKTNDNKIIIHIQDNYMPTVIEYIKKCNYIDYITTGEKKQFWSKNIIITEKSMDEPKITITGNNNKFNSNSNNNNETNIRFNIKSLFGWFCSLFKS